VRSYHAVNLAIHLLAALTLFGLLRRTLARMGGAGSAGQGRPTPPPDTHLPAPGPSAGALAAAGDAARQSDAAALAFAIALLWALHPLQTEAVTYVVQRAESLAGLFFLLTLYGFVRAVESGKPPRARHWFLASIVTCLLGMASKEVMVSAPLIVLLYDRTFVAGSFAEACRRRGRYYAGLAATWLLLAWLVLGTAGRGGTAGLGTPVPWSAYALTQGQAIVRYLQLAAWPHPLVFDYGTSVVRSWVEAWWQTTAVLALLGLAIWALFKKPRTGFLAAAFFVILAPTSSVVPVATQTMAEHRMYLPLVSVITLLIL